MDNVDACLESTRAWEAEPSKASPVDCRKLTSSFLSIKHPYGLYLQLLFITFPYRKTLGNNRKCLLELTHTHVYTRIKLQTYEGTFAENILYRYR